MIEYAVYGMVEPKTHRIVYINYTIYDWNIIEEYPNISRYFEESIDLMNTNDENDNPYWRDLYNMYKNKPIEVVVLEVLDNEDKAQEAVQRYINWFKPRYNVNEIKHSLPPYMTIKPEDIVPSFHVDEDNIALYCEGRVIDKEEK